MKEASPTIRLPRLRADGPGVSEAPEKQLEGDLLCKVLPLCSGLLPLAGTAMAAVLLLGVGLFY